MEEEHFNYRTWVKLLPSVQIQEEDPYDLQCWRYTLHKSWSSLFVATHNLGNEAEIRNGTENLFELAFQRRSGWQQLFK